MRRYDRVAFALHWGIGLALILQIAFGFLLDDLAPRGTPLRAPVINLHKSIGLVLLALIVARLAWRLAHRPPPWPKLMPRWQVQAANWGHRVMYACMLLLPASGWIASNFSKHGVKFFGIALGPWGPDLPEVYRFFNGMHKTAALVFAAVVAGHVAAALWHRRHGRAGLRLRMSWSSP